MVSILHFNSVPLSFASNKRCKKRWRAAGEHVTAHQVHEARFEHHVGPPPPSHSGLFERRHAHSCPPVQRSNEKLMVVAVQVVKVDGVFLSCKLDQLLIWVQSVEHVSQRYFANSRVTNVQFGCKKLETLAWEKLKPEMSQFEQLLLKQFSTKWIHSVVSLS